MAGIPAETPKTRVPLPPSDARVVTTACEYCPVACGYKAYIWPAGSEGGPAAADNALATDFPSPVLSGRWPSPNMHTTVTIDGRLQNVLVMPDPDAEVVNVGGNHSVRGGTLALKLYRPDGPTRDRLQRPLLRVNGTLQPISWDAATDIVAALIRHVIDEHGELAMGFKVFSYQYFENTFAATKFALGALGTPNYAPHHNTAGGTDTPGLDDTGVDAFSAGYVDYRDADVIMIIGTDPYETKTVAFTQWIAPGGATLIQMDPRKTFTAAYAVKNGGLHLQVKPGTDAWVLGAIARYILEQSWEDADFVRDHVTQTREEIDADGHWRRRLMGRTWDEFREAYLDEDDYTLERASEISGVPVASIQRAAELLAQPVDGEPPKASLLYEKGLYWTHQYENTAALGNLSALIGARGRPGRATSRMGGHQRGGASGAPYPFDKSPTEFNGQKLEMDCDRWTVAGRKCSRRPAPARWRGTSMFQKAPLTLDRSPFSEEAIARVADVTQSEVIVLEVLDSVVQILGWGGPAFEVPGDVAERLRASEREEIEQQLEGAAQQPRDSGIGKVSTLVGSRSRAPRSPRQPPPRPRRDRDGHARPDGPAAGDAGLGRQRCRPQCRARRSAAGSPERIGPPRGRRSRDRAAAKTSPVAPRVRPRSRNSAGRSEEEATQSASSTGVEHLLPKQRVEGSNPFSRSRPPTPLM